MTMTANQRQGLHGEGFVFAMASSAGLLVTRSSLDVDGVDWMIGYPGPLGRTRSPKIEVQVKTCSVASGTQTSPSFRMRASHFNNLAGSGFLVRRFLFLLTVLAEPDGYAACDHDAMRLGHAAYWKSLADESLIPDGGAQTLTVTVPRDNLLTPESLLALVVGEETGR